jgi:hypothetical protein
MNQTKNKKFCAIPLNEKIQDMQYLNSLGERNRKYIDCIKQMIPENELCQFTSITTAYKEARYRYIKQNISIDNQNDYIDKKRPIFWDYV